MARFFSDDFKFFDFKKSTLDDFKAIAAKDTKFQRGIDGLETSVKQKLVEDYFARSLESRGFHTGTVKYPDQGIFGENFIKNYGQEIKINPNLSKSLLPDIGAMKDAEDYVVLKQEVAKLQQDIIEVAVKPDDMIGAIQKILDEKDLITKADFADFKKKGDTIINNKNDTGKTAKALYKMLVLGTAAAFGVVYMLHLENNREDYEKAVKQCEKDFDECQEDGSQTLDACRSEKTDCIDRAAEAREDANMLNTLFTGMTDPLVGMFNGLGSLIGDGVTAIIPYLLAILGGIFGLSLLYFLYKKFWSSRRKKAKVQPGTVETDATPK